MSKKTIMWIIGIFVTLIGLGLLIFSLQLCPSMISFILSIISAFIFVTPGAIYMARITKNSMPFGPG